MSISHYNLWFWVGKGAKKTWNETLNINQKHLVTWSLILVSCIWSCSIAYYCEHFVYLMLVYFVKGLHCLPKVEPQPEENIPTTPDRPKNWSNQCVDWEFVSWPKHNKTKCLKSSNPNLIFSQDNYLDKLTLIVLCTWRVQVVHGALAFCPPNHCRAFIIQYRCVNHMSTRKKISHEFAVKCPLHINFHPKYSDLDCWSTRTRPGSRIQVSTTVVPGFIVSNWYWKWRVSHAVLTVRAGCLWGSNHQTHAVHRNLPFALPFLTKVIEIWQCQPL
jgi:hypothetical protein